MPIMCCCFIIDFKDMYDDVIDIVDNVDLCISSNVIWYGGCALAL